MQKPIMERVVPNAGYIWGACRDSHALNVFYLFRKELSAEQTGTYTLYVSAQTRYRLHINGKYIYCGPPPSNEFVSICDVHEVTLEAGPNCVAAEVWKFLPGSEPYFILEMTDQSGKTILATGGDWPAYRAPMWRQDMQVDANCFPSLPQECYDSRKCPEGWKLPGFDDRTWPKASVVEHIPLVRRDIPFLPDIPTYAVRLERAEEALAIENRKRSHDLSLGASLQGKPLEHSTLEGAGNLLSETGETIFMSSTKHMDHDFALDGYYDPYVILDFGKVITGYAEFSVDGVRNGILDFGYAERLIDGHFVNMLEGIHGADRYIMKGGREYHRFFAWKSFRYLKLRVRDCFEPVTVHYVRAAMSTYPYEERGRFDSADERLNKVFDICRYTIRLCSHENLMDTPWREQGQYTADVSAVTLGGIYACFGNAEIVGKYLWQTAMSQMPSGLIAEKSHNWSGKWVVYDGSAWWANALWDHYMYTGDERWVVRFYPQVARVVYAVTDYLDKYGLLGPLPYRAFVDWAKIEGMAEAQWHVSGESSFLNAQFYGVAKKIIRMAELIGDYRMAKYLAEVRAGIGNSFHARLFDREKGVFADVNEAGRIRGVSEHSNMAPILWGLSKGGEADSIIDKLFVDKSLKFTMAEPFATAVTLRALDAAGRADVAYKIIRDRWGAWMADRGATSLNEEWGHCGSWRFGHYTGFMRSLSHAWGGAPAEFLIKNTIGLEIAEPGCGKIHLNPKDIGVDYTAVYPLPQGGATVRHIGGICTVTLPEGVKRVD